MLDDVLTLFPAMVEAGASDLILRTGHRPVMRVDGEIVDRLIQPLAVSYDHRVIDGAYAARFVGYIAFILSDVRNLIL